MSWIAGAMVALGLLVPLVPSGWAMRVGVDNGGVFSQSVSPKNDTESREVRATENVGVLDVTIEERVLFGIESGASKLLFAIPSDRLVIVEDALVLLRNRVRRLASDWNHGNGAEVKLFDEAGRLAQILRVENPRNVIWREPIRVGRDLALVDPNPEEKVRALKLTHASVGALPKIMRGPAKNDGGKHQGAGKNREDQCVVGDPVICRVFASYWWSFLLGAVGAAMVSGVGLWLISRHYRASDQPKRR